MAAERYRTQREWLARNGAVLAVMTLALLAFLKILTYVTGQDPRIYIVLARQLVQSGFSAGAFREISDYIVPGYPLVLALSLKLFGPFAPYWVNPIFVFGAVVFLGLLVRRGVGGGVAEAVVLLVTLYVILSGYNLNAHYLFYPFRGAPELFLMFLGLHLLQEGVDSTPPRSWRLCLAAAGVLLVGSLMRETVCFVAVGAALWLFLRGRFEPGRTRRADRLAFLLPFVVAVGAVLIWGLARGSLLNLQSRLWLRSLLGATPSKPLGLALREMLELLGAEFGWLTLLLAVGVIRVRKHPRILFFFLLHAVLLFVFYGCYKPHPRYLLTVVVFLGPVAGLGAVTVLGWLARVPRMPRGLPVAAAIALLLALNIRAIHGLGLWGPRVTAREITAFTRARDSVLPPGAPLLVDKSCRFLVDAITTFTDLDPVDPLSLRTNLLTDPPHVFAEPLDAACYYPDKHGIRATSWILHHADLAAPVEFAMGDCRYRCARITPWSATSTEEPVPLVPGRPMILWLDFGASDADAVRNVSVWSGGAKARTWRVNRGRGLQGFYLGREDVMSATGLVRVTSSAPLPARLLAVAQTADAFHRFDLTDERRPSSLFWLAPPFEGMDNPSSKYGVIFTRGGVLRLPEPYGAEGHRLGVLVVAEPRYARGGTVTMRYRRGAKVVAEKTVDLDDGRFKHSFAVDVPRGARELDLQMEVDVPEPFENHFRMIAVGFGVE